MPHSLDVNLRHTLFVLKESVITRKLTLPAPFPSALVYSPDQVLHAIQRALTQGFRLVVIVSEDEAVQIGKLIQLRLQREDAPYGVMVISKAPSEFLRKGQLPIGFLDVISEKEARKDLESHLLRTLQHLVEKDRQRSQKIGPETLARLNEIFIQMSSERRTEPLLDLILNNAIDLTDARGGSLYLVEEQDGETFFRMKVSTSDGKPSVVQTTLTRAMENSLCGYSALTGKTVNVGDLGSLKPFQLPIYSKTYDHEMDGLVSVLTLPMKNSRNEVVAIIQVANKKSTKNGSVGPTLPFEPEDESILNSLGTQAAICFENVDLYADIQRLFEGFVYASITAIESRDPSTGGHSGRVAKMSIALARATSECEVGVYRSVRFKDDEIRELEYAALLHDFGKIGVREEVLVKAKKLYPYQLEAISERIKICKAAAKIQCLENSLRQPDLKGEWEKSYHARVYQLEEYWNMILSLNEPKILHEENANILERIRHEQLLLPDGSPVRLLSDEEYHALAISQGSLTEMERLEIESHVRHTYQFLKMIPWTKDFKHLTEIAYAHHEKLDGTGYPRGLMAHEIPLQSKIMTIADIFDALTAADRWYKEAVPTMRAIEILGDEVYHGKIDPVLYELFVEKKIYEFAEIKDLKATG